MSAETDSQKHLGIINCMNTFIWYVIEVYNTFEPSHDASPKSDSSDISYLEHDRNTDPNLIFTHK